MWRKKKWVLVIVLAVVVVTAVGVIGGVVYAQPGNGKSGGNHGDEFMARVAEKLGVNQADLEEAFKEARQELADEAFKGRLDRLAEEGIITQDEAGEYYKWWQSRPDVPEGLLNARPNFCPQGPIEFKGGMWDFPGKGRIHPFNSPDSTAESD
ncbi:MAG: hypothetical protein JXA46_09000 [Dehalococcoidales bacterium]|nr:hypothetical protein [Dehalococcoidales bacterium]